jgi:hypothetical protein
LTRRKMREGKARWERLARKDKRLRRMCKRCGIKSKGDSKMVMVGRDIYVSSAGTSLVGMDCQPTTDLQSFPLLVSCSTYPIRAPILLSCFSLSCFVAVLWLIVSSHRVLSLVQFISFLLSSSGRQPVDGLPLRNKKLCRIRKLVSAAASRLSLRYCQVNGNARLLDC